MKADRVEMSWDADKSKWLVRIIVGEEVIRRYCNAEKDADKATLGSSAVATAAEEGYEVSPADVSIG